MEEKRMKARLINDGILKILCANGTILENPNKEQLYFFLSNFKRISEIKGPENIRWDIEYPDMNMKKGETLAYITDSLQVVIEDFSPFLIITENREPLKLENMLTVPQYALKVGRSIEAVKVHLRNGRIPGAMKFGRDYAIPEASIALYPQDRRKASIRRLNGRSNID
jgi:hypothetical protein